MTPPEGVQVLGRWQQRFTEQQDRCPDCGGGKTRRSLRCQPCAAIARRLPARDLAAYWHEQEAAA